MKCDDPRQKAYVCTGHTAAFRVMSQRTRHSF